MLGPPGQGARNAAGAAVPPIGPGWLRAAPAAVEASAVTWLQDLPPGGTEWDQVTALAPDTFDAIEELHRTLWTTLDPVALELCRLRIAALLDAGSHAALRSPAAREQGLTEDKIAALSKWPSSPLFTDKERACLAFTEQFLLGPSTVTQEHVDALLEHMDSPGTYQFVMGLWATESLQRTCLTLDVSPDPEAIGLVPVG
jgi:alkylhydroperoxidase family enzyme